MAATIKNVELVPQKELNNLIKYNKELLETKNNLGNIIPVLQKAALGVETYTGDYKTLVQIISSYEKIQADTTKRINEHAASLAQAERAAKTFMSAVAGQSKEAATLGERTRQTQTILKDFTKEVTATEDNLKRMRTAMSDVSGISQEAVTVLNSVTLSQREVNEVTRLAVQIDYSQVGSKKQLEAQLKLNQIALDNLSKEERENSASGQALSAQTEELKQRLADLSNTTSRTAGVSDMLVKAYSLERFAATEAAAELQGLTFTKREASRIAELAVQLNNAEAGSYRELEAQYNLNTIALRKMSAERASSAEGKAFVKKTAEMREQMAQFNQELGDYTMRVGNYERGFTPLQLQVQQLVREMPSLTISLQQFFVAISNNLPMFADEITRIRKANELALKNGEKTIPVIKQIISSLFSWQTALVLAITVLASFGKEIGEFISGLFKGKKAIDAISLSTEQYQNAIDNANKSAADELSTLKLLYNAATDNQRPMNERIATVKELQRLYPNYLGNMSQEEIMAGQASIQYRNLATHILEVAKAKAVQDKISENQAKILELEIEEAEQLAQIEATQANIERQRTAINSGGTSDIIVAYQKQLSLTEKRLKREQESLVVIQQSKQALEDTSAQLANKISVSDLIVEQPEPLGANSVSNRLSEKRRAELELLEAQAQQEVSIQEQIYKDEERAYADRLEAFEKFKEAQQKVLEIQHTAGREELDARLSAGDIDKDTYDAVLSSLDFANSEAFRELTDEQQAAGKELMEAIAEGMMAETTRAVEQSVQALDSKMQDELLALSARYAAGEINAEEYEKERAAITDRYAVERFNTEIGLLDQLLNKEGLTAEAREETEKAKADAVLEYEKYINDQRIRENERVGDEAEKEAERQEQIAQKEAELKKQLLQEVFNLASALSDAQLEKELSRLDKLSEESEQWKEDEIARIERLAEQGVISEEHADADIQAIEDQAALREEEIEKKRIEAERRNAIFEKAQAVAQAAINTALAITAALTSPLTSAVMIPLIAATGAAQIATILATPLPEYAKGTQDHPGGLAMVGDGGRAEMVVFPDGSVWRTPATDTLVNLPEHTQVLPDYDAVIAQHPFRHLPEPISTSRMETLLEEQRMQRGTLIEKSAEQNRLLRKMLTEQNADRRISERTFANHNLIPSKKIS